MRDIWQRIDPPIILSVPQDSWIAPAIFGLLGTVLGAVITIYYSHREVEKQRRENDIAAAIKICMQLYYIINTMSSYKKYIEDELNSANENGDLFNITKYSERLFMWWPIIHPTLSIQRTNLYFEPTDMNVLAKHNLNKYIDDVFECIERYNSFISNVDHYNTIRENITDIQNFKGSKVEGDNIVNSKISKEYSTEFEIKSNALDRHIKQTYFYVTTDLENTLQTVHNLSGEFRKKFKKDFSIDLRIKVKVDDALA